MADAAAEVMMWLSMDRLSDLHKFFLENENELSCVKFVQVMLDLCGIHEGHTRVSMTTRLIDLFAQIDVNGDGAMEWDEFSGFVVESGMALGQGKAKSLKVAYEEVPSLAVNARRAAVRQILPLKSAEVEGGMHGGVETNADGNAESSAPSAYVDTGYIAVVHEDDMSVCIFKALPEGGIEDEPQLTLQAESCIIAIELLSNINLLVASCANMSIAFWDLDDKTSYDVAVLEPQLVKRTREPQFDCVWDSVSATLFTSTGKVISTWEVRRFQAGQQSEPRLTTVSERKPLKHANGKSAHSDLIRAMVVIPQHGLLASTGMDSVINIWNTQTLTFKKERRGHKNGVRTLGWAVGEEGHGLLLSAGFDLDIMAWDIFGSASNPLFKLCGHETPVLGIQTQGIHAFALDDSGVFKMWDLRQGTSVLESERCLQTFSVRDTRYKLNPTAPLVLLDATGAAIANADGSVHRLPDILCGDARLRFWRTHAVTRQGGSLVPAAAVYNSTFMWIMTSSGRSVFNFSSVSGHAATHFANVANAGVDIMSMCLDGRQRKLICGTSNGGISVHNCLNGAIMKFARSGADPYAHTAEVSVVKYCDSDDNNDTPGIIFSASWDGSIKMWDDREPNTVRLLRCVRNAHGEQARTHGADHGLHMVPIDITAAAFSLELSLIATGGADGSIRVWDFQTLFPDGPPAQEWPHEVPTDAHQATSPIMAKKRGPHGHLGQKQRPSSSRASTPRTGASRAGTPRSRRRKQNRAARVAKEAEAESIDSDMLSMAFLSPWAVLATGDATGRIGLWNVRGGLHSHKRKQQFLGRLNASKPGLSVTALMQYWQLAEEPQRLRASLAGSHLSGTPIGADLNDCWLIAADERGYVLGWRVANLMEAVGGSQIERDRMAMRANTYNPWMRKPAKQYDASLDGIVERPPRDLAFTATGTPAMIPAIAPPDLKFRAHESTILSICEATRVGNPGGALVTAAFDGSFALWSIEGICLGRIVTQTMPGGKKTLPSRDSSVDWLLDAGVEHRLEEETEKAVVILKEIQKKKEMERKRHAVFGAIEGVVKMRARRKDSAAQMLAADVETSGKVGNKKRQRRASIMGQMFGGGALTPPDRSPRSPRTPNTSGSLPSWS